ncbi:MFS general substrate transporter [Parathielavia appendiculata]|uniref:MFS general substrate transporter n=1 Tax=Parathielavia appendiculata TaxID=2587402 RepID=A0AAN6YXX0_9PEZI|nr:MFS general substrate transporter [Parathielavia appendiculata]
MAVPEHPEGRSTRAPNDEKQVPNQTDSTDTESGKGTLTSGSRGFSAAPDGGARAWLVVAGAACIFFSCLGFMNSFGVFQEYYMANQLRHHSPDDVAWIGSLTAFLQFAGGALAGPMFDRFGAWVIRPGAVLYVFALMMSSICKEYWQFMLAQGVLAGFAMSMLQVPAFAAVSQYFDKKRGAALGLVVSGSSIGGVIFPIALSKMLNGSTLGFGWSVRVMAFVVTPLLAFSSFAVTSRLPPRKTSFFIMSAFREARFMMLIVAAFCCFIGMYTPLFYIPTYAVSRGMERTLASYLLAIVNAASTFGRIIPGILADRFGRLNVFGLGALLTGIIVLCMNTVVSTAGLIVYSVFFGFTSGTIISGASAALSICTDDAQKLGTYMGMGMALASTASLVGPPVNGVLLDTYGGFLQPAIFSGVICLAGGVLAVATKVTTPKGLFGRA